jgi:hypothetical protein
MRDVAVELLLLTGGGFLVTAQLIGAARISAAAVERGKLCF